MGKIAMKIRAINWTMGDVGHVWLQLKEGKCRVDWGDGRTSVLKAPPYQKEIGLEWLYTNHEYPKGCKENEESFTVSISSEEDNIVGFLADSGDMMVKSVDLGACQELEYLKASYLIENLDITTNPNIRRVDLHGDAAVLADFSNSTGLEKLILTLSDRKTLNISECAHLKYLDCSENYNMTKLAVNNNNLLEYFNSAETPIEEKYLRFINIKD